MSTNQQQSQERSQGIQNSKQIEEPKKKSGTQKLFECLFIKKWHPQPNVNTTILIYNMVGIVFIILSIVIAIQNAKIQERELEDYQKDTNCIPVSNSSTEKTCIYKFTIPNSDMKPPIYLFYGLTNFYQNHRRFMKSKSNKQLSGDIISSSEAKDSCEPIRYNKDIWDDLKSFKKDADGQPVGLDPNAIASPCGLIAKSMFNDTYELYSSDTFSDETRIEIDEKGIAWPEDVEKKFKRPDSDSEQLKQWLDVEDEHFIVWMRTSGLPDFRKLWGKINTTLKQGTNYYFRVQSNYDVDKFDGTKDIVLSTSSVFGGKNSFLFIAFLLVGILCMAIGFIFILKRSITGGSFGEGQQHDENEGQQQGHEHQS